MWFIVVYLISTCALMINSEEKVIRIAVRSNMKRCEISSSYYTIESGSNITINIESNAFLRFVKLEIDQHAFNLSNFNQTSKHIIYDETDGIQSIVYNITYTCTAGSYLTGVWKFEFCISLVNDIVMASNKCSMNKCATTINVVSSLDKNFAGTSDILQTPVYKHNNEDSMKVVIIVSCLSVVIFAQGAYIVYSRYKCMTNTANIKGNTNEARTARPPMPLPLSSYDVPISPTMPRNLIFDAPKEIHREKDIGLQPLKVAESPTLPPRNISQQPSKVPITPTKPNLIFDAPKEIHREQDIELQPLKAAASPKLSPENMFLDSIEKLHKDSGVESPPLKVAASPRLPPKNKFIKSLEKAHRVPDIERLPLKARIKPMPVVRTATPEVSNHRIIPPNFKPPLAPKPKKPL